MEFFFIKPTFSKKASSPTKWGECLAMGKPIIHNAKIGDINMILESIASGIRINEFSEKEYEKSTSQLKFVTHKVARNIAMKHFNIEYGINSYDRIYYHLANLCPLPMERQIKF